jgi:O-acetyl-ADP-ribose deacetylase (regulator of RNase III)
MILRKPMRGMRKIGQKGQAMVEYIICAAMLILALFVPFGSDDRSVADMLTDAIKRNHEARVFAIGNPAIGSTGW